MARYSENPSLCSKKDVCREFDVIVSLFIICWRWRICSVCISLLVVIPVWFQIVIHEMKWLKICFNYSYFFILPGLCLNADKYDGSASAGGILRNSVRLEICNENKDGQFITCGPHSGYLLKLRQVGFYIVLTNEFSCILKYMYLAKL